MTSDEIKQIGLAKTSDGGRTSTDIGATVDLFWLREIALQLALLNEREERKEAR